MLILLSFLLCSDDLFRYRTTLKQAYSPMMAHMLTFYASKSTEYSWKEYGLHQFPDENFARELMQLFTVGLVQLDLGGTELLNKEGRSLSVYNNEDIMEYSRVWTGFGTLISSDL